MVLYIVSYDIANDDRRREVAELLESYGRRLQYSVFECLLGEVGCVKLKAEVNRLIHHQEDQVMFLDLGPMDGRARQAVSVVGRTYEFPTNNAIIL